MNDAAGIVVGLIVFFAVWALIFLICREIVCWYFKINQGLEVLRSINSRIATLDDLSRAQLEAATAATSTTREPQRKAAEG